jgi:DNA processing protein
LSEGKEALRYWLALLKAPQVGCRTYLKLLQQLGEPERLFNEPRASLTALGLKEVSIEAILKPDWQKVDEDMAWAEKNACRILKISDDEYPPRLKEIADPPPVLFVRGDVEVVSSLQLALVGSRNPSLVGKKIAEDFSRHMAMTGLTITSGLALGIDAVSHQGALDVKGKTVAVTGTGLDRVYPARHKRLAELILEEGGALVSEFSPGAKAHASHFPRRNRIISGLSVGVLVVEAAISSGSLITARLALEQGREVFAIPGSIHNPLARGCNALIRQGAKLVETAEDVIGELAQYRGIAPVSADMEASPVEEPLENDAPHQDLLHHIGYEPTSIDLLATEMGARVEVIYSMLLVLELKGIVSSAPGGCYYRVN